MASIATAFILTTIDKIIERANEVKVCEDHTKLITTSLKNIPKKSNLIFELVLNYINGYRDSWSHQ